MSDWWYGFTVGVFIGGAFGMFVMALAIMSGDEDCERCKAEGVLKGRG